MNWARKAILQAASNALGPEIIANSETLDDDEISSIGSALTIQGIEALNCKLNDIGTRVHEIETNLNSTKSTISKVNADLSSVSNQVNAVTNSVKPQIPQSYAAAAASAKPATPSRTSIPAKPTTANKQSSKPQSPKESANPQQRATPILATSERRMYSTLEHPAEIPENRQKAMMIPQILANTLKAYNIPHSALKFTATINANGTVSVTAPQGCAASIYSQYYTQMAKAVQDYLKITDNSYTAFRPAPTKTQVMVNRVPTFPLPSNQDELRSLVSDIIYTNSGVQVEDVRRLNPTTTKATTSLVVTVSPSQSHLLTDKGVLMFNKTRPCNLMWQASAATQCTKCWGFGHPSSGCKETTLTCRICASHDHSTNNHPCPIDCRNKSKGFCEHMAPMCANCLGTHQANDPKCPTRINALNSLRSRTTTDMAIDA
jgi:hypothetical protein